MTRKLTFWSLIYLSSRFVYTIWSQKFIKHHHNKTDKFLKRLTISHFIFARKKITLYKFNITA